MDSSACEPGSPGLSRFGPFTLDAARCELRRNGVVVALRPKTYALLVHLVAYPGRVAVLMDQRCFSAADVCLAALREFGKARERAGLPPIILIGQPSAGGSGLSREERIAGGRIKLRLSSMVSYMPDGHLFEGRGVQPDVEVKPKPTDFTTLLPRTIHDGSGDDVLDEALRRVFAD